MPKNIRQIGLIKGNCRIYMEDYVYTFLGKYAGAEESGGEEKSCLAVLTGETKWDSGDAYVFIKGALTAETEELSREHIEFTDQLWQKIHQEMERCFEGQEIVGWFFCGKSADAGSFGNFSEGTFEKFWRRRQGSAADGSGRKRRGLFQI